MDGASRPFLNLETTEKLVYVYSHNRMVAGTRDTDELKMFVERYAAAARWRGAASVAAAKLGTSVPRRSAPVHCAHYTASEQTPTVVLVFICQSLSDRLPVGSASISADLLCHDRDHIQTDGQ